MAMTEVDSHQVHFAFLKPIGQRKGGKEAVKTNSNINEKRSMGRNCPVFWNLSLAQGQSLVNATNQTRRTFHLGTHFFWRIFPLGAIGSKTKPPVPKEQAVHV